MGGLVGEEASRGTCTIGKIVTGRKLLENPLDVKSFFISEYKVELQQNSA